MAWYRYRQRTADSEWKDFAASELDRILTNEQPPFVTVLEVDKVADESFTGEDYAKLKFRGEFYVDFDGESLEEVIPQFKRFLKKLKEAGVNLGDCQLSVTGGRGFHVLVPMKVFVNNPSGAGYTHLPIIYKEMAQELYVDTLDLRVYSAKRGRMWRTFGVQRPNGLYKVQITPEEAEGMTVDLYKEIASTPRPVVGFPTSPATSEKLMTLFAKARDKVSDAMRKRAARKSDKGALSRFGTNIPPTIEMIMSGENVSSEVGFQRIATQLAITAHALNMSEQDLLDKSARLCENHQSDGSRYDTPAKRRKELSRMYQYMEGNPCYDWSVGGVVSILKEGTKVPDLQPAVGPEAEAEEELEEDEIDPSCENLIVRKTGIWVKVFNKDSNAWEAKIVSTFGLSDISELFELESFRSVGYEATVTGAQGSFRVRINNNDFESKTNLRRALGSAGHMRMTDQQAGGLQTVLSRMAEKGGKKMISVRQEGVNIIKRGPNHPHPTGQSSFFTWWVDANEPYYFAPPGESIGAFLRLDPLVETNSGQGRSDLQEAPKMEDNEKTRDTLDHFFSAFPKSVTAKIFGWYTACFLAPLFRHHFGQFPVLQSYGTAGGGKTSFNYICAHLHAHLQKPLLISTPHATPFAMESPLASSFSIPVLYDEVKFSEMDRRKGDAFKTLVRNNYNGNSGAKGKVSRDTGSSKLTVAETANVAPLAFMSESKVDQEAILHRSVLVAFPHTQIGGAASAKFMRLKSNAYILGGLGRIILDDVLRINVEGFGEQIQKLQAELVEKVQGQMADRPMYNLTVVLAGLRLADLALSKVFGDRYKATMEELANEIMSDPTQHVQKSMSEVARVIDTLAAMSDRPHEDPLKLRYGVDWLWDGQDHIQIHVRNSWDKYTRLCRAQGITPLFDREQGFIDAIYRHPSVNDIHCLGSQLKNGRATAKVLRLNIDVLRLEDVEDFSTGEVKT